MTDGASEYFVLFHHKVLVACAVEVRHRKPGTAQDKRKDGRYAGRVRLAIVPDRSAKSLCGFVENAVAPGTLTSFWATTYALGRSCGLWQVRLWVALACWSASTARGVFEYC
jgi:hypothetical protein